MSDETGQAPFSSLISVVLNSLLEGQKAVLSAMATKEDIQTLSQTLSATISQHEARITELEEKRLPSWFWPTLSSVAVIVGSITAIVELLLTHANTVANVATGSAAASALTHAAAVLRNH